MDQDHFVIFMFKCLLYQISLQKDGLNSSVMASLSFVYNNTFNLTMAVGCYVSAEKLFRGHLILGVFLNIWASDYWLTLWHLTVCQTLSNSYTMGCPPVRGDNPRALASGLSYVQVNKHGITILYHLHQCRPCTSRDISL